ncbi:MAG: threonine--tRNA ligase, partial [Clostridia bacterium]|nr:threonine--tRNA ligase [Clostridia bacterium]
NFDLKYVAQDGTQKRPVMIHRAIFGSMERFIGILIENFKGAFPFWLSPVQVGIVPIRPEHNAYAEAIADKLRRAHIRFEVDYTDKNMKEKIKTYKNYKDPYILVVGDKEAAEGTVSVNMRGNNRQIHDIPLDDFISVCRRMNEEYTLELADTF